MQGIQKVVFDIIKTSRDMGLPYITKTAIIEEAKNTSLVESEKVMSNTAKNVARKKENKLSQLDWQVTQALFQLNKKKLIKQRKRGHWTITKNANKYIPVICKVLERQYEIYCPKCDKYTYKVSKEKSKIKNKCDVCGKILPVSWLHNRCSACIYQDLR